MSPLSSGFVGGFVAFGLSTVCTVYTSWSDRRRCHLNSKHR